MVPISDKKTAQTSDCEKGYTSWRNIPGDTRLSPSEDKTIPITMLSNKQISKTCPRPKSKPAFFRDGTSDEITSGSSSVGRNSQAHSLHRTKALERLVFSLGQSSSDEDPDSPKPSPKARRLDPKIKDRKDERKETATPSPDLTKSRKKHDSGAGTSDDEFDLVLLQLSKRRTPGISAKKTLNKGILRRPCYSESSPIPKFDIGLSSGSESSLGLPSSEKKKPASKTTKTSSADKKVLNLSRSVEVLDISSNLDDVFDQQSSNKEISSSKVTSRRCSLESASILVNSSDRRYSNPWIRSSSNDTSPHTGLATGLAKKLLDLEELELKRSLSETSSTISPKPVTKPGPAKPKSNPKTSDGVLATPKPKTPKPKKENIPFTPKSLKPPGTIVGIDSKGCPIKSYTFLESLDPSKVPQHLMDPEAKDFVFNYNKRRELLTAKLFKLFNEKVFINKFSPDYPVIWSPRLLTTAGFCKQKKTPNGRISHIELSTKVLTSAERLRDTLIHEMCHAAVWMFSGFSEDHGPWFYRWARKAMEIFPELAVISRCHNYEIFTKFTYKCTGCSYSLGRHSKSINLEEEVCPKCRCKLSVIKNIPPKPELTTPESSVRSTPSSANRKAREVLKTIPPSDWFQTPNGTNEIRVNFSPGGEIYTPSVSQAAKNSKSEFKTPKTDKPRSRKEVKSAREFFY